LRASTAIALAAVAALALLGARVVYRNLVQLPGRMIESVVPPVVRGAAPRKVVVRPPARRKAVRKTVIRKDIPRARPRRH
jgi:hypothetical protein